MSRHDPTRIETEMELLEAMYPGQTKYHENSREFKFSDDGRASLLLRLPEYYPESGSPDVISATDAAKNDLRSQTKDAVKVLALADGEEALDAIIDAFQAVLERQVVLKDTLSSSARHQQTSAAVGRDEESKPKTMIVWLHHLLNTNKRKLALSPPPSIPGISGITKPGYPGILIYSGPYAAVSEHVDTLKAQNWQAFQVRLEEEELWHFAHGEGVKEVESMSDVVKSVECVQQRSSKSGNRGKRQKDEFLKAVGIK